MVEGLLWIMGTYGAGVAAVHLVHAFHLSRHRDEIQHYVLVTNNNQQRLEGFVRWIVWLNWLRGVPVTITVVDYGSEDETLEIVDRISNAVFPELRLLRMPEDQSAYTEMLSLESATWIRLDREEDVRQISVSL